MLAKELKTYKVYCKYFGLTNIIHDNVPTYGPNLSTLLNCSSITYNLQHQQTECKNRIGQNLISYEFCFLSDQIF